ncbi:MAG TPA: hypothetical protein VN670_04275 [Acidobacteriaceae bacterium]|nr:hypothetical protein [Acidobacteriaceae bacterium]
MRVITRFIQRFPLWSACLVLLPGFLFQFAPIALAQQEPPYFVTYSSVLEEPGNLEIENQNIAAAPKDANAFFAPTVEFEYGATAWWTTEFYLQGQATQNDSAVFTGFRFENRFRPLPREYWINPVLYVEYENVNGADKSFLEITGNDTIAGVQTPNAIARKEVVRTMEEKLILSSNVKGWDISENFIGEKAVNKSNPWEFGYALAAARPLALVGGSKACTFCRQNIAVGAEMFGGLGTRYTFGLKQTQHYAGPTIALNTPSGWTLKFSPEFGLNDNAAGVLWRFGASYEIQQFRDWFRRKK